jgi:hypothetical protein
MAAAKKIIAVFKRLETDKEFRERMCKLGRFPPSWVTDGNQLDFWAWESWQAQRRIVEDVQER